MRSLGTKDGIRFANEGRQPMSNPITLPQKFLGLVLMVKHGTPAPTFLGYMP
jgi:hypothetical protein